MMFACCCREDIPAEELIAHLRRFHPGTDAIPEFWPDGGPVYFEEDQWQ